MHFINEQFVVLLLSFSEQSNGEQCVMMPFGHVTKVAAHYIENCNPESLIPSFYTEKFNPEKLMPKSLIPKYAIPSPPSLKLRNATH